MHIVGEVSPEGLRRCVVTSLLTECTARGVGEVVGEWEERKQGGKQGEVMGAGGERGVK